MVESRTTDTKDTARKEERSSEILTLPNLLSLARVLITPVFIWAAIRQRPWLTFGLFFLAGVTDALDGFTARAFRLKTNMGLWLDPLGDKILLTAAFVVLTLPRLSVPNVLPLWLTVTCIGRDVLLALGSLVYIGIRGKTVFRPSLAGKISTICAVATLLIVLLANGFGTSPGWLIWLYVVTAVLTGLSGIHYIATGLRRFFRREGPAAA
jgi:cardiolipin synthase (CMP-forming)